MTREEALIEAKRIMSPNVPWILEEVPSLVYGVGPSFKARYIEVCCATCSVPGLHTHVTELTQDKP